MRLYEALVLVIYVGGGPLALWGIDRVLNPGIKLPIARGRKRKRPAGNADEPKLDLELGA